MEEGRVALYVSSNGDGLMGDEGAVAGESEGERAGEWESLRMS